jgi:p-hydroxybenzoate 3-monooxygenase
MINQTSTRKRTRVCIIGGGPSGLLLSQLLHKNGIESIILERQTKQHVLSRIRAGVLEQRACALLTEAGVGKRLALEGIPHSGTLITHGNQSFRVDFKEHTGTGVIVYGQTEITADLYKAHEEADGNIEFEVTDVILNDIDTPNPFVTYHGNGEARRIECDFIAGCDGFHGVSRKSIPDNKRKEFEKVYPFGWLGLLSQTPPADEELIYSNSDRGFALCSMRNENLSRYYIQCNANDSVDNWSDEAFWEELKLRIPDQFSDQLVTGPSIEKSIAPLRSFVTEPMQYGALFLCGDAAHIVPPTGAKGLNTAISDVYYLYNGLRQFYEDKDRHGLDGYSAKALARVWKVERFSWWFSSLMHQFPANSDFDQKMQVAELAFLQSSEAAQKAMAENYIGLPY